MPKLSIKSFKGLYPSIAPRLLPEGGSQVAIDCDFSSGSLQPFRSALDTFTPSSGNQINTKITINSYLRTSFRKESGRYRWV